jgi:hypothetical protein
MKFIAPSIEERPAICKLKIKSSTEPPECAIGPDKGGYKVHPVPTPISTTFESKSNDNAGGINQKLILLSRGKAISREPIMRGTIQFPKPPIKIGISIKKIIINACAVTKTLYS